MLHEAGEQGIAQAQHNLGIMYDNGKGVDQSHATAVKWYRKAAEQGYATAHLFLGATYAKGGLSVPQNFSEALQWLHKAEAAGDPLAAGCIQEVLELQRQKIQQQQAAREGSESTPLSSPPLPSILVGARVELHGLRAKPELNGQRGVVTDFDASTGRCSVQLEDGRGPYNIKPGNLKRK